VSFIGSPFCLSHVTSRENESLLVFLIDEEHNEVAPRFGLPQRRVDVLPRPVPLLHEVEPDSSSKDFPRLESPDTVFLLQLLDDILKPDDAGDPQSGFSPERSVESVF